MRLEKYIVEKIKFQFSIVKKILEDGLDELWDMLEEYNFELDAFTIASIMTDVYAKDGISFFVPKVKTKMNRYVQSATYWTVRDEVDVAITKNISKGVAKFKGGKRKDVFFDIRKNDFMKMIHDIMVHEWVHKDQIPKDKTPVEIDIDPNALEIEGQDAYEKYLSNKEEIQAYAQQAATELIKYGRSDSLTLYKIHFDIGHPVRKRFMKKLYQYFKRKV